MKSTTSPKARKRLLPICPEALRYEQLKAELRGKGLSPTEYARVCLRAAQKAGL